MNTNPSPEDDAIKRKLPKIPNVNAQEGISGLDDLKAPQASNQTAQTVIKQVQGSMLGALSSLPEIRTRDFGPARISDPTRPAISSSFAEEVRDREFAPPAFQPVKNDAGRRLMEAMEERQNREQEERQKQEERAEEALELQRRIAETSEAAFKAAVDAERDRTASAQADAVVARAEAKHARSQARMNLYIAFASLLVTAAALLYALYP